MQSVARSRTIAPTGSPTSACALTGPTLKAVPTKEVSTRRRPRVALRSAARGGQRGRRGHRRSPVRGQQDEDEARGKRDERGEDKRDAEVGGLPDRGRAERAGHGSDVPQRAYHAEYAATSRGGDGDRDESEPRGEERGQPDPGEVRGRVEQEPREPQHQRDPEERDREARRHGDALPTGAVGNAADQR